MIKRMCGWFFFIFAIVPVLFLKFIAPKKWVRFLKICAATLYLIIFAVPSLYLDIMALFGKGLDRMSNAMGRWLQR